MTDKKNNGKARQTVTIYISREQLDKCREVAVATWPYMKDSSNASIVTTLLLYAIDQLQ